MQMSTPLSTRLCDVGLQSVVAAPAQRSAAIDRQIAAPRRMSARVGLGNRLHEDEI